MEGPIILLALAKRLSLDVRPGEIGPAALASSAGASRRVPRYPPETAEIPTAWHAAAVASKWPVTDPVRLSPPRRGETGRLDHASIAALRHHLDTLVDGTHDGIYAVDPVGRTTLVTPSVSLMTGRNAQELVGAPVHDVLHHSHHDGQHYPRETCPIYAACCAGQVERSEAVFWRKDGSKFPIEYTTAPLVQGGEVVGGVVVFRDLDAIRALHRKIRGIADDLDALIPVGAPPSAPRPEDLPAAVPLGRSESWLRVTHLVERVARADTTVLLLGESGTGKELVANAIHQQGPRRGRPLVKLNCAAIPMSLVESELFGHERGAFTGATGQRIGRFEQAGEGTIFLDEVGELPLEAQAKLLRVLQEHEFERVGGTRTLRSKARIIAATNRDLAGLVASGRFRSDLYYRLNVFPLALPPLRQRRDDIPLLAEHFLRRLEPKLGRVLRGFTPAAEKRLVDHDWPGNVRELANVIERAAVLTDGDVLEASALEPLSRSVPEPVGETEDPTADEATIVAALESAQWKVTGPRGAATVLGIHPNTLRYRMRRLGIRRPNR
jgi:PAS domain S-box-containing protein